jgi:hypothetical protein
MNGDASPRAYGYVLVEAGVLGETTGKKRDRSYAYSSYLDRLRVGTDLDVRRRSVR